MNADSDKANLEVAGPSEDLPPALPAHYQEVMDALGDSATRKLQAGEQLGTEEANAYFAEKTQNPINQVYFRAGLIACREYMARFVEVQSPEIAASIRANWWPALGADLGGPRRLMWNEVAEGDGEHGPIAVKELSPTLEALPVALQFFEPTLHDEIEARSKVAMGAA